MEISSSAFGNGQSIPGQYTCDGKDVNPPLAFRDRPGNAKSLALIVDDPDTPAGTWVHWTIWNIDPDVETIDEDSAPEGAEEGRTSFGRPGYSGPCPPSGTHRYFFRLYALDCRLKLPAAASPDDLASAIAEHILDSAELHGLYGRT